MKIFQVGGCVRDRLLGRRSKDIDYSVECGSYEEMRNYIAQRGTIYLENPDHFTIRGKLHGIDADFVLCRRDGIYSDGRRPDSVEIGTIDDDLARRDFRMNAIAIDENNNYLDPHDGRADIEARIIRCVGEARDRFGEDALRMLRAIRFAVTLGFDLDGHIQQCLEDPELVALMRNVSVERQREELNKALQHDTWKTVRLLTNYVPLARTILDGKQLWLQATLKAR